ncbi:hypothetical protein GEMRC1_004316 [Eukaryota sp. GEM-RC1]
MDLTPSRFVSHLALVDVFYVSATLVCFLIVHAFASLRTIRKCKYVVTSAGLALFISIAINSSLLTRSFLLISGIPLVSVYNGLTGLACALISFSWFLTNKTTPLGILLVILPLVFGTVTFSYGIISAVKLRHPFFLRLPSFLSKAISLTLFLVIVALSVLICCEYTEGHTLICLLSIAGLALVIGLVTGLACGGATLSVLITVLKSLSGVSVAFCGILTGYNILVIVGILVGCSGLILSRSMSVAMNRSIFELIFAFKMKYRHHNYDRDLVQQDSPRGLVDACLNAKKVLFVPGFGLAQAKGGPVVAEIMKDLQSRGIVVNFCVHPVAGRMPGQMAVILAQNGIPYELIFDLDELKGQFESNDVAIAVGCADTINPIAEESKDSNLAGMPICPIYRCKKDICFETFKETRLWIFLDNCRIVLDDARVSLCSVRSILFDTPKFSEKDTVTNLPEVANDAGIEESKSVADKEIEEVERKTTGIGHGTRSSCFYFLLALGFSILITWIPNTGPALELFCYFSLTSIVGFIIVSSIPVNLYSLLMSLSNGISGIVILGALKFLENDLWIVNVSAIIAGAIASFNMVGGLTVTYRMHRAITR